MVHRDHVCEKEEGKRLTPRTTYAFMINAYGNVHIAFYEQGQGREDQQKPELVMLAGHEGTAHFRNKDFIQSARAAEKARKKAV